MKQTILAQVIAREFTARREMEDRFRHPEVSSAVLLFLKGGTDDEDRAASIRLALGESNRRATLESIMARAKEILEWPLSVKPEPAPEKKETVTKAAPLKRSRR